MAVPLYMIGPLRFLTMQGQVIFPTDDSAVDARPGVEGLQFTLQGARGRPFTMFTRVDVSSYGAGLQYFSTNYLPTIRMGLLPLIVNDCAYEDINLKCNVIRVSLAPRGCYRAYPIVNGLTAGSTHLLEAEWELALVQIPS